MGIADAGSLLVVIISAVALWLTRRRQIITRTQESAAVALSGFASLEQMIKDVPGALRFHGISEQELAIAGITAAELSYFLSNMTTGGIYYRTTEKVGLIQFFNEETGYYGEMFKHAATRNAWAICRRCLAPSVYRDKLDWLSEHNGGPLPALSAYHAAKDQPAS